MEAFLNICSLLVLHMLLTNLYLHWSAQHQISG